MPCQGCSQRKQWIKDNPVPVVALAGVSLLVIVIIIKGR